MSNHICDTNSLISKCKKCTCNICRYCTANYSGDSEYDNICENCMSNEYRLMLSTFPKIVDQKFELFLCYPKEYFMEWHSYDLKKLQELIVENSKLKEELHNARATIEELELRPPGIGGRLFLEGQARAIANGMRKETSSICASFVCVKRLRLFTPRS